MAAFEISPPPIHFHISSHNSGKHISINIKFIIVLKECTAINQKVKKEKEQKNFCDEIFELNRVKE